MNGSNKLERLTLSGFSFSSLVLCLQVRQGAYPSVEWLTAALLTNIRLETPAMDKHASLIDQLKISIGKSLFNLIKIVTMYYNWLKVVHNTFNEAK